MLPGDVLVCIAHLTIRIMFTFYGRISDDLNLKAWERGNG